MNHERESLDVESAGARGVAPTVAQVKFKVTGMLWNEVVSRNLVRHVGMAGAGAAVAVRRGKVEVLQAHLREGRRGQRDVRHHVAQRPVATRLLLWMGTYAAVRALCAHVTCLRLRFPFIRRPPKVDSKQVFHSPA